MSTEIIPPCQATIGTMYSLMYRAAIYLEVHDSIPENLSELPKRKNKGNGIRDGWLRKIKLIKQKDGLIVLRSYGRNGKVGGTGGNADITFSFRIDGGRIDYELLEVGDEIRREQNWKKVREFIDLPAPY
jgi:hypothetical protein